MAGVGFVERAAGGYDCELRPKVSKSELNSASDMMAKEMKGGALIFIGGSGGLARETLDALLAGGQAAAVSFFDPSRPGEVVRGLPVVGLSDLSSGASYVTAVADAHARRALAETLESAGLSPVQVRHPLSATAPETILGAGTVMFAFSYVSSGVVTGHHCHINYGATVGHDTLLEDFVTVLPGARVSGRVRLGTGSTIGAGAVVLPQLSVGTGATVGAGAVVTRDVPPHAVVKGVPARS